jgi:hypothetical protein
MRRFLRRYPATMLALVFSAVMLVTVAYCSTGAAQARHDFVKRCAANGGQLVPGKVVYYCVYPDGRMEQG